MVANKNIEKIELKNDSDKVAQNYLKTKPESSLVSKNMKLVTHLEEISEEKIS